MFTESDSWVSNLSKLKLDIKSEIDVRECYKGFITVMGEIFGPHEGHL